MGMSNDSPGFGSDPAALAPPAAMPGLLELFTVFAGISLSGFGGVLVWARRAIVERRRWMTAEEFNDSFALCQVLSGPNIVNMSVMFGARAHGIPGALAAFFGLMGPPTAVIILVAAAFARFGDLAVLQRALAGLSAAAVGLFIATVIKMAMPLVRRRSWHMALAVAGVFVAVGVLRLPMPSVLACAIPAYGLFLWAVRR
jgi:chromate transporter